MRIMYSILLIDDEKFVLEQISESIEWKLYGFKNPIIFTDASEAFEYIKLNSADAVITDIKMNKMSGLELVKLCKESYPKIKFAIMSAYRDFEYAKTAITYGVNDYLVKPIIYDEFSACIKRLSASVKEVYSIKKGVNLDFDTEEKPIMLAIAYMNQHISEPISLKDVASHVGFHPNYFSTYFRQHMNENFLTFFTKLRISRAKMLLRNTDLKISAVCEQVGYKNQTHFYNLFREHSKGMTPLQYKNQFLKGEDQ